jgi:hypothetical protein
MTARERSLAIGLSAAALIGGAGFVAYQYVLTPLQEKRAAADALRAEVDELEGKARAVAAARPRIAEAKRQSLPPDQEEVAKPEYRRLLERLFQEAGMKNHKVADQIKTLDSLGPAHPKMGGPKQPAYTRLEYTADASDVNVWQVADFLRAFLRLDLLHQITAIEITRDDRQSDPRSGLKLHLVIEALILDGAEPRASLFPVTNAVAAAGGNLAAQAVARKPEVVRGLTPAAPVLSPKNRDYSYLAYKDIFYGILEPKKPITPYFDKLADVVLARDEKGAEARVRILGDAPPGVSLTATAAGALIPPGALKVVPSNKDPKAFTVTVPAAALDEVADDATSTVSVVATVPDGSPLKGSFTVSLAKLKEVTPPPPLLDIAGFIKLTGLVGRGGGDESVLAIIHDDANPYRYEVTVGPKRVEVVKLKPPGDKGRQKNEPWRKDRDYDHPPGVLAFTDDFSGTKRTFKVVAVDADGLVLSEAGRVEPPKDAPKGPRGPRPKQGPADPLAAVAGAAAAAAPAPVYYRWGFGKSLKELVRLTPAEASKVLKRVAAVGPLVSAADKPAGN